MDWHLFGFAIPVWIYVPAFLLGWWGATLAAKFVISRLAGIGRAGPLTRFPVVLVQSLLPPVVVLIIVTGPIALLAWTPVGERARAVINLNILLAVAVILASIHFVDRLLRRLVDAYGDRVELFRTGGGLIKGAARGAILALGALILLDTLGVSITPIIASLGIGSLAVALALQPTLENAFAGMQIVVDQPVRPGHFIRLESGEEGYVERIGWRATWIRMLSNNMVIIPNKQLVSSRVTNFYYPSKDLAVLVDLGVHYGSDLARVERVTVEVGEAIMKTVTGGVAEFKPFIRYNKFDDSSVNFTVILRGQEFVDNYLIKHEFIKALHRRYAEEGIVIPFPIRAINLEQEGAHRHLAPALSRPA